MEQSVADDVTALWSRADFRQSLSLAGAAQNHRVQRFSTLGLRSPDRIELWEEHNARALVGLAARTLNGTPLEATELNLRIGELQIAHVTASAHVVERNDRQIALTPCEGVALYFTIFGESFFYDEDGVHLQRPGGLLLCDINRPFMRGFAQGLQEFVLTVPRSLFEEIAGHSVAKRPTTRSFARIPGANEHAAQLARLVQSSLASDDVNASEVEASAVQLLRMIFSEDAARGASYRAAAMAYIDRSLGDSRLSVGMVAHAVGISERHLARIFAEAGSGVARAILDRRLDLARRVLASPGRASVGDIASQCGFTSHAHFTRVFRERFEETPVAFRIRAGRQ